MTRLLSVRRKKTRDFPAAPIRGELLGAEKLAQRASALARAQRLAPDGRGWRGAPLLVRLDETRQLLNDAHARIAAVAAAHGDVGPAGDWLLDNYHVVQAQIREVRESLPRQYYRELPELSSGRLAGYPRVYEIGTTLIAHTEGRLDLDSISLFLGAFQREATLSIGELWALPAMLRLGLIENVRRMSLRTVQRLDEVESADRWVARIQRARAQDDDRAIGAVLNDFLADTPPLTAIFVARFLHQLRLSPGPFTPLAWIEQWVGEDGMSSEQAAAQSSQRLALTQIAMANSITSLRAVAQIDWRSLVESQSAMDAVLRGDPSGFYLQMTFATRDWYRHVVERIAKRTRMSEEVVAGRAIELARARGVSGNGASESPPAGHVGYYLIDDGLAELERETAYRPRIMERVGRWAVRHPNIVYFGGVLLGTALIVAAVASWVAPASSALVFLAALLTLVPASEVAVSMVNHLVTNLVSPRILPKLELRDPVGIPREYRTAVVVPTLFESVDAVRDSLDHLERQFLANRTTNLHFVLLSDFTDAPAETQPSDDAIVRAAVRGIEELNARYHDTAEPTFYLFHRSRQWNEAEQVWMGWERKRGKINQFNGFLRGGSSDAFSTIVGDTRPLRGVRYVITLDDDTVLAPDAGLVLVGTIAHPLNRAVLDVETRRVRRGYGIIQPRVGVSLPSAFQSRFAAIHSGHPGVDPYTTAVSDTYQDLFGEGSYTGKGLYDVDVFEAATEGRFPDNRLLSHDLIEGNYARAALASDIEVYDSYPARYLSYVFRKHRWVRGDWQLLDWLTPHVPGPSGQEPNRLSLLSRWKLLDNLRRSTVEIAHLALLVAGWTILPGSAVAWTLVVVAMIVTPWITSLVLAAIRLPFDKSWLAYYAGVWHDAKTSAMQIVLALAFLPHLAWVSADAIGRTLWRLTTKRRLLEWRTASQAERLTSNATVIATWRAMRSAHVLVAAIAVGVVLVAPNRLVAAIPLLALWVASPAIAHALSASPARRGRVLSERRRDDARRYALAHWKYFDQFVTAETNWLVPDNYQDDPEPIVAMRTSPTNIGLQLLATVSACDLGFITAAVMAERLELAFRSLERMQRFRGHFYNWYELSDLRVLEPAYISTVDSGNLAGHLLAVRQACLTMSESIAPADLAARLRAIAERAYRYAIEMDFKFLFDRNRKLFSIGYHEASRTCDASFYDLLASEARLASLIAIAKDDVDPEHWFHLGRAIVRAGDDSALVSWSGSVFEYLMPLLVMESFPATLLEHTYDGAIRRHISYGDERNVPWGISESAYNVRDRHLTYQYRAFGVPDLALKRGLGHELVVAPYASALAIMVEPHRALDNLGALERLGALGPYGFRDAIDYTRPDRDGRSAIVKNYMAHHVGMSLVAMTNALTDNIWHRRFHADPLVRSVEVLLHERVPRRHTVQEPQVAEVDDRMPEQDVQRPAVREIDTADTSQPVIALLGDHPYTIMVSNAGGGYSRYEQLAVTRWRADATRDASGQFCYVKDLMSGRVWSAAHQPVRAPADSYHVRLATDRVSFSRTDGPIETGMEITVVAADGAEIRRVTLTNHSGETRELEVTSYGEIVLAPPDADRAHPAFGNLFVETEWHAWCTAVTATRRPRSAKERPLWLVHVVDAGRERVAATTCETDRMRFIGRGRSVANPVALEQDGPLSGSTGSVLDPIFALRTRVRLEPGQSASVAFTTFVADSRERAFELADRYDDPHAAQRAFDLAWTAAQIELRELSITPSDAAVYQQLAGNLFYSNPALRAPEETLVENRGSQPLLWSIGISGDWPILLATITSAEGIPTLRQLLGAHHYWRRRGVTVDLVVLNAQAYTYLGELTDRISAVVMGSLEASVIDRPGGVFIRRLDQLDPQALLMLRATARVHVESDGRSLSRVLEDVAQPNLTDDEREPDVDDSHVRGRFRPSRRIGARLGRMFRRFPENGDETTDADARDSGPGRRIGDQPVASGATPNYLGGVTIGGDYEIHLREADLPPAPWSNVIANPRAGFVVTERGGGFTWADNSYFYRLSPWHNDPVTDPASEVLYLRDDESGDTWSATPAPAADGLPFTVRHGAGKSTFEHDHGDITTHLTLGVHEREPVKLSLLEVTNRGSTPRKISVCAYVEWSLGVQREHTQHQVNTWFDAERVAIFARNTFEPNFAGHVAFCAMSERAESHSGDRRAFLGRNGSADRPIGLNEPSLDNRTGAGLDPCAALKCTIELAPNETRELVVLLGAVAGESEALHLAAEYRTVERAKAALEANVASWKRRLSVIQVRTPEPSFDAMLNHWLLYQALGCRMWARSALYQSSGAFGFRDQLQDTMAFVYAEPGVAREHILRAAARQFVEGDVQHWWHVPSGRGVRTRFSDDLAWLPFVVDQYVRVTGDAAVLDELAPFLAMRPLEPHEHEVYDLPQIADEQATIYEHCVRALRKACTTGVHGLPLIGIGDWNDGFSRVGVEGRGESVWLAWFLVATLRAFAKHADGRGDAHLADEFRKQADAYVVAVETHGWDGAWYRRAYFDDGTPLGSATSDECRIDAIAQSWSVISGAGDPARQATAMQSLEEHLVRNDARLLMLLTPPFDKTPNDPGYIKGYLPGVRENGAQYTHAALWTVLATAMRGDGDRAFELFQMINPLTRTTTRESAETYKVEPYVVAADVYTAAGHLGRGGWTWYTGSASWMYRVGIETILGFTRRGNTLTIDPRAPRDWPELTIQYQFGNSRYDIVVKNPGAIGTGGSEVTVDGHLLDEAAIPLVDDGARHEVVVRPRSTKR